MIRNALFVSTALALGLQLSNVTVASAEQRPTSLPADARIKTFVYNENTVYRLDVFTNFISTIQFARGEVVSSIQVGDSASWQIVRLKRGDVISVKPLNRDAVTNMTVYTDRRVYTFILRARRGRASSANQNFRTTFKYPTAVLKEYQGSSAFGPKNYNYEVAGSAEFAPIEVYDNGKQTFFRFGTNAPRPAIYRVGAFRREALVNSRAAGDTTVVDGTAKLWTVRIGGAALCVRVNNKLRGTHAPTYVNDEDYTDDAISVAG